MNVEIPKRLTPTKDVLIRLFAKSGNHCAFEGCSNNLFNAEGVFIAEVCHIEAALPGGERFNAAKSNEQRREESNLILFCKEHHKVTDNKLEYLIVSVGELWTKGDLYQKTSLQNLLFPVGIQYNRKTDTFRTDKIVNIFRKTNSFPSDYENNKGGKLDWNTNYSALVDGAPLSSNSFIDELARIKEFRDKRLL
jgi:hypothetical protein